MRSSGIHTFLALAALVAACENSRAPQSASEADRSFIDGMVPHHGMAMYSADMAFARAVHPELRLKAREMKEMQGEETALLVGWKKRWLGTDSVPTPMMPRDSPGGTNFDLEWMRMMVTHHQGAIDMATLTLRADARPESDSLAQAIIDTQREEQRLFRTWAQEWYGVSLSIPAPQR